MLHLLGIAALFILFYTAAQALIDLIPAPKQVRMNDSSPEQLQLKSRLCELMKPEMTKAETDEFLTKWTEFTKNL